MQITGKIVVILCAFLSISTYIYAHKSPHTTDTTKSNVNYYALKTTEEGTGKTDTSTKEHSKDQAIEKGPAKVFADVFLLEWNTIKTIITPFDKIQNAVFRILGLRSKKQPPVTDFLLTTGKDTETTYSGSTQEKFKEALGKIIPDLKWCGPGNLAENNTDLGKFSGTDSCCRKHDKCPNNILAGKSKYGLKNNGLFTRSECWCDQDLYNCLKTVNTTISNAIGKTYFDVLGPQCFKRVDCSTKKKGTCRHHKKSGWEYEWADNPKY